YPGVVEEAVDRAIGVERGPDIGLHLGRFGDVGGDKARLSALLANNPGGRLAGRAIAIDDHYFGAAVGETECGGAADAVPGAGDQRDLAGKVQIHGVPPNVSFGARSCASSPRVRRAD